MKVDHLKTRRKKPRIPLTAGDIKSLFNIHGTKSISNLSKQTGLSYLQIYNLVHGRVFSVSDRHYRMLFQKPAPPQAALKIDGTFFRAMVDLWLYLNNGVTRTDLYREFFKDEPDPRIDHRIFSGKIKTIDARFEHIMRQKFIWAGLDDKLLRQWLEEHQAMAHADLVPYSDIRPLLQYLENNLGIRPNSILKQSAVRYESGELQHVSRRIFEYTLELKGKAEKALMESELFGYSKGAFTGALENRSGKLEMADTGTLFLDDIDLLDINMQARLLRVLQEKEYEKVGSDRVVNVDIKFIAASNKDLRQLFTKGKFREDLFYRLNVFPIELPPLRERKEDIPELLNHFLNQNGKSNGLPSKSFTAKAVQALMDYDWPGNVRELENFVERLFIVSQGAVIRQEDVLPLQRRNTRRETQTLKKAVADFERQHIKTVLNSVGGRRGEAAKILGIHRNTLTAKINDLEIVV